MNYYHRHILRIAVPSIVSNITVPLLGLVDVAITGHLGSATYLGAIAVGGMLFNIIYWMFGFLRMGTSGLASQARGARDLPTASTILLRSLAVSLALGVALIIISPIVREAALLVIAPTDSVGELARLYFNICIFGAPPSLALFALNGWLIGMQNSRTPMLVAITQNVVNIAASLTFVYALGMKVEGVAAGTVTAQWSALALTLLLLRRHYRRHLTLTLTNLWARREMTRFFTINRDIFFRTLCLIAVHFAFIAAGARLGERELAVNTLLMQLFTLYSYFMDGFAYAGEALTGKAVGAGDRHAVRATVRGLFQWGAAMATLFTLLYAVGTTPLLSLLTNNGAVITAAMSYRPWTTLLPLAGMAAFVWDGIYIGATETRGMLMSSLLAAMVFVAICLPAFHALGNHALWAAFIAYLATRGIVLTYIYFTRHRQLDFNCAHNS